MDINQLLEQLRCLNGNLEERKKCRSECTVDTCPLVLSYWGYRPNIPVNAGFAAAFVIFLAIVLVQGIWTRRFKRYTAMMFIGSAMEVLGYVARIYAYSYPFSDISFITQLTSLTLAPAFYAAAIYFSLARIVVVFGEENSRIPPKYIPRIFITCDVISLVLQAAGGALAAWYAQKEEMPDNGNYTMMGGLSFQAFTLFLFLSLSTDFAIKTARAVRKYGGTALNEESGPRKLRKSKRFRALLFSLTISALLIFMRSIYRVVEISEGWKGDLMTREKYVIWLEAIPVAISGAFLAIFHPANCFKEEPAQVEQIEMPETPPSFSSMPPSSYSYPGEKYGEQYRYGKMTVTLDPTFDRKAWR